MKKERFIGLVILTKTEDLGWIAILRRRGWFSIEKIASQHFQGVCQVTVNGKCKEGESPIEALVRKMKEGFGLEFCKEFDLSTFHNRCVELNQKETNRKMVITYGIIIPFELVLKIRIDNPFDRLEKLMKKQAFSDHIRKVNEADKEKGIQNMNMIAMFPDEKKAVLSAFEKLT
ncbi:MAG: hypothetical protein QGG63_00295 [Candidatus Pacebacteria bacterium]|nr:hypothetical protein [Candidatus Paceibacterota bacterium]